MPPSPLPENPASSRPQSHRRGTGTGARFAMASSGLVALACVLAAPATAQTPTAPSGDNCEVLRTQIETRIRGAGVVNVTLVVLDNAAVTAGRVLGTCGTGTRKIVQMDTNSTPPNPNLVTAPTEAAAVRPAPRPYVRVGARAGAGAGAVARDDDDVITECKDGSMSIGGNCKRP